MPIGATFRGMMATPDASGYVVDAAVFDGDADYMLRGDDLTGNADGSNGLFSCWVKFNGGDGTTLQILANASSSRLNIERNAGNKIQLKGWDGGTNVIGLTSTNTFTESSTWHHICASWNGTSSHLYINGSQDEGANSPNSGTIEYQQADWSICSKTDASTKMDADIAEVYFALEYLDISDSDNLEKFRSSAGKPVNLGSDGSTPTGTAAIIYQHLDDGEAVANFKDNAGTGGGFNLTGTLVTAGTSPSD